ncbi:DUF5713 family protein [Paenibacillus sp. YIM B09110]|uniref:DUF5713 family protein n=1 Tax=Paenibacillus sp. YIM B09110 TaxID=3126102 RepID=UPI003FA78765
MDKDYIAQLISWHQEDEHEKIVERIMEIPQSDRDYETINLLARAMNNLERYDEALQQLLTIANRGENDPLWHFRAGYSYYYLEQYEEAIREFEMTNKLDPDDSDNLIFLARSRSHANVADPIKPLELSKQNNGNTSFEYLKDMYIDNYFPNFLVDKVKAELVNVVEFLEQGNLDIEEIQSKFDLAIQAINDLAEEFDENDSEIETVARESIAQTVANILTYFKIQIDTEEAIRERDW